MTFFCIEILGESAFHKCLVQSGWSGKDYAFYFNRPTNSHIRAYRRIEDYRAERVDLHKSANIWPLLGNLLPAQEIEPHLFVDGGASGPQPPSRRKGRGRPKNGEEAGSPSAAPALVNAGTGTDDSGAPLR